MAVFKCKMCGATLEIENESVAVCSFCGTGQTLPRISSENIANLYDRASHFRRNNEYDKAISVYEKILNEDITDSEAYWSLVLCRYGIEYVEEPSTRKRIPTVNRAQFTSVFDDDNYKSALQYADAHQRAIYESEAKAINEIQRKILAISQNEEPFDVFICYKETDKDGRRTPDSVLANDLYHQLTQEGFKVFFSRITLEDKLGTAYEPYIFAALNSAKAMVVLGTKKEYFAAVWVQNEWSRFLSLIKQGQNKILIPAYRDMDPYDLPEEFSHLQAQDMSKLGFMQDLIRGIKKIIGEKESKTVVVKETVQTEATASVAAYIKRAFLFLEDGVWSSAEEYCEKALDIDPECAEAYLGKLMAELRVRQRTELKNCNAPFDRRNNYIKAMRFADDRLKSELQRYADVIFDKKQAESYDSAVRIMQAAIHTEQYNKAAEKFKGLHDYRDSAELAIKCFEKGEELRLSALYDVAVDFMFKAETSEEYLFAAEKFEKIVAFKDAAEKEKLCREFSENVHKEGIYSDALADMEKGIIPALEDAIVKFNSLGNYKDSIERSKACDKRIAYIVSQIAEKERSLKEQKEICKKIKKTNIKNYLILFGIRALICLIAGCCYAYEIVTLEEISALELIVALAIMGPIMAIIFDVLDCGIGLLFSIITLCLAHSSKRQILARICQIAGCVACLFSIMFLLILIIPIDSATENASDIDFICCGIFFSLANILTFISLLRMKFYKRASGKKSR